MNIDIVEDSLSALVEHATISIEFEVYHVLAVVEQNSECARFVLSEHSVDPPFTKDYDALESPLDWPIKFDMSNWALISAHTNGCRVGGAIVAFNTPDLDMLEGRNDLAVLWDLRISEELRRQGVGQSLFQAVEQWAVKRGCTQLKVETQNINVPACKFYAKQGCSLEAVNRSAYANMPDEIQMLWYKDLCLSK